jgi:hypothetical protein
VSDMREYLLYQGVHLIPVPGLRLFCASIGVD